jgi:ribosomal protein S18 acetylase RimI-like enzyme
MEFTIKLAETDKEINSVHQVMLDAFAEYSKHDIPSSAMNESVSSIQQAIHEGIEQAIIGYIDEKPLGSARIMIEQDSIYFKRLSVSPEARGKGMAKKIIQWLAQYAKEQGKEKIYCRVRKDTPLNIEMYQHFDFEISKEETIINKDGYVVDTVLMEKAVHALKNEEVGNMSIQ